MNYPIGDFPIGQDERDAINRVMDSGRISEGREVRAFEDEFADYLGVAHCVAVNSGTAALMVGLKALEYLDMIPNNARVLIPALTFIATANAVMLTGNVPVFGDVSLETMCLEPAELEKDFDIALPVHLFGIVASMDNIFTRARGRLVCEDACEAHGATYWGTKAGTMGAWGAFSFYIAHTVQAGEFGALVTDNGDIARVARQLKAHGRSCQCRVCTRYTTGCKHLENGDPRFRSEFPGYNFKPMEFQAALARVQLKRIDDNIAKRRENARELTDGLRRVSEFCLPTFDEGSVPMAYPVVYTGDRDGLIIELQKLGVESRPIFGSIPHQQPAYRQYADAVTPVSDHIGKQGLYVGCHQYLHNIPSMCERILEGIRNVEK